MNIDYLMHIALRYCGVRFLLLYSACKLIGNLKYYYIVNVMYRRM